MVIIALCIQGQLGGSQASVFAGENFHFKHKGRLTGAYRGVPNVLASRCIVALAKCTKDSTNWIGLATL
jgi:hypothetical protein